MPTKKKRVGFIPREDVMKIIDMLSIENNLSNSKIIGILVEEALSIRGIFNKKTGKISQSYKEIKNDSQDLFEYSGEFKDNDKFEMNNNSKIHNNSVNKNLSKEQNKDDFDHKTYKQFISFLKFQKMIDDLNE